MTPLTPRQQQVLDAVRGYVQAHGFPPTIRELGQMIGVSSPATVAHHLEVLEQKGCLVWERGRARTIQLRKEED